MAKEDQKPTDLEEGQEAQGGIFQKFGHIIKSSGLVLFFIAVVGLESPTSKARASTKNVFEFKGKPSEIWLITIMTVGMLIVCLVLSVIKYGPKSLKQIYNPQQVLDFVPFALCFAFCNAPKSVSANFMDADLQKVLTSMKTVFAALVFGFTKVHRYSMVQKLFLFLITVIVVCYVLGGGVVKDLAAQEKLRKSYAEISDWQFQFQGQPIAQTDLEKPINSNLFVKNAQGVAELKKFDGPVTGTTFTWTLDPRVKNCIEKGKKIPNKALNEHIKANGGWSIPSKEFPLLKDQNEKDMPTYIKLSKPDEKTGKKTQENHPFFWKGCEDKDGNDNLPVGLFLIAIHLFLHAWGSWFGEKALKKGKNVPYIMQKATEMSIALVSCLIQLLLVFPFVPKDAWDGMLKDLHDDAIYDGRMWDGWTTVGLWSYFIVFCCRHFIAGIIVKNLNTIVKQVASNASFMIVYFMSLWWAGIYAEPFGITRKWEAGRTGADFKEGDLTYNIYFNKFGVEYVDKVPFIGGSTDADIFLIVLLVMVTGVCLGWAVVSKYTKCKNNWKKLYLELKESEDALNSTEEPNFEQAEDAERAPLVGEQTYVAGQGSQLPPPQ